MKKSYFFKINRFPYGKIRQLLLPLKLTVILSICITLNAVASNLGVNNTSAISVQQKKVSGTVTDASNNNEPLVGVSIAVVGTNSGTITDAQGKYSLVLPNGDVSLQFSFVGYVTETVKVNGQSAIDVKLNLDVKKLDEVVVIGYGSVKKSDLSGSVASVNTEEMIRKDPQNVTLGLQGAAAGVVVTQQDGAPDGNVTIRVRGTGTINGSALPLYVVDGIPIGNAGATNNSAINFLNPNDIESIEVLKDASATAIYGSVGANGVVMITTKHGAAGVSHIDVSVKFGIQTLAWELPTGNIDQFSANIRTARANDGSNLQNNVFLAKYDGTRNNIDWQKQMTRAAVKSEYNVSATGGTEKTQSVLSLSYLNNDGLIVNSNMNRLTARANIINKAAGFLEIGADINFVHQESHGSNGNTAGVNNANQSALVDLAYQIPTLDYVKPDGVTYVKVPVVNANGTYGETEQSASSVIDGGNSGNLYADQMENDGLTRTNQVVLDAYANVKLLKGLSFKVVGSYNYSGGDYWNFSGNKQRFAPDGVTPIVIANYSTYQSLNISQWENTTLQIQNYLTYNWKNDIQNLTLLAGFDASAYAGLGVNASSHTFQDSNIRQIGLTTDATSITGGGQINDESHGYSYYGRLIYSLKDRYILTATIRQDASSNFGVGNQLGVFPSASLAWRVSEENFLKGNPAISNLKLRLSWGQSGNSGSNGNSAIAQLSQGIYNYANGGTSPADYKTYPGSPTGSTGVAGTTSNGVENSGIVPVLINTNLKWETETTANLGVDLGLYKNWTITLDVYNKINTNLLLWEPTRPSTGYSFVYTNFGSIQNKGIELALNYKTNITKDFSFGATVTGTSVSNRAIQIGPPEYFSNSGGTGDGSNLGPQHASSGVHWDQSSLMQEGYAIGTFYGYKVVGIFQSQQEVNQANAAAKAAGGTVAQQSATAPGDFIFQHASGDAQLSVSDRKPLGNGFPKFNFSLNLNAAYKNLDLSVFSYGVVGAKIFSYSSMILTDMFYGDNGTAPNILTDNSAKAWTPANHSTTVPRLSLLDLNDNMAASSAWVKSGNYYKISNVQFGYSFPKNLLKPLHVESARVNVSVQNLLTISPYRQYGDPEAGQGDPRFTGTDGGRYPYPRIYSVGLNLQF